MTPATTNGHLEKAQKELVAAADSLRAAADSVVIPQPTDASAETSSGSMADPDALKTYQRQLRLLGEETLDVLGRLSSSRVFGEPR